MPKGIETDKTAIRRGLHAVTVLLRNQLGASVNAFLEGIG
jgi:hypothetical protein